MTLLELLITIAVISIIGTLTYAKFNSPADATIAHQAEQFSNQVRHAQSLAQNWGCQLTLVVNNSSYEVRNRNIVAGKQYCNAANTVIRDPASGDNLTTNLKYGVQFNTTGSFYFDIKGVPRDTITDSRLSNTTSFSLTGDTKTYTISISHITGFVSVSDP